MTRSGAGVTVRLTSGVAGLAGLCTCGSVWSCPVCGSRIAQRRALEIAAAVAAARAAGFGVAMITLTERHDRGQSLKLLWDAQGQAWRSVLTGKLWLRDLARFGVVGWLRVVEVTWGRNGWHVHVHVLVFMRGDVDGLAVDELGGSMFGRWRRSLVRSGLAAPLPAGQDFQLIDGGGGDAALAEYLAKQAGFEMAYSQSKGPRSAHSTESTWSLLDRIMDDGDASALRLWHEYEAASSGRRQLTWSRSIRSLLGLDAVEESDEDIAAEELGSASDDLVVIRQAGWLVLIRQPGLIVDVYEVTERSGQLGLSTYLRAHGIDHDLV